jgi:hypothetical protein
VDRPLARVPALRLLSRAVSPWRPSRNFLAVSFFTISSRASEQRLQPGNAARVQHLRLAHFHT